MFQKSNQECKLYEIPSPLKNPNNNSPNPCFIVSISIFLTFILTIWCLSQLVLIRHYNYFGPYRIKYAFGNAFNAKSAGLTNTTKLVALSLQFLLISFLIVANLHDSKTSALIFLSSCLILVVIPLHISEITRSIVPHASLLVFWSIEFFLAFVWLLQDSISPYKLFINNKLKFQCLTAEVCLVLNSFTIILLETWFTPTIELINYFQLNEWNYLNVKNFFTDLLVSWVTPVLDFVYKNNQLNPNSVPDLDLDMKACHAYNHFMKYWDLQLTKKNPSLLYAILFSQWRQMLVTYIFNLLDIIIGISQPFLLQKLLVYYRNATQINRNQPVVTGLIIVAMMFVVPILRSIFVNRSFMMMYKFIFRSQSSLSCAVYNKSLRLAPEARKNKSSGDIINHLATDIGAIEEMSLIFTDMINNPLYLVLCIVSLLKLIGKATWGGIIVAIVLIPLSGIISSQIYSLYDRATSYKDNRIRFTSEILSSIKSVKFYSWETPMMVRLGSIRNEQELKARKKLGIFNAISTFLWSCIPFLISCACFGTYSWISDIPLTPEIVFPCMTIFDLLTEPLIMLPNVISDLAEIRVSIRRLQEFFLLPELENQIDKINENLNLGDESVIIEKASFLWEKGFENYALKNIEFKGKKGELTCIVGKVGSGKTTLLKAMLGEMYCSSYKNLKIRGCIAYCSQSPWILNESIKENILFGTRFNEKLYNATISSCELISDFESLPDGDKTLVGEKGISLSGGQKARISLARAVYSNADIYLLDDVLSAVDAHVGKNIFEKVLSKNGILSSKTIILATNSVKFLPSAQQIAYMENSTITEKGTYEELISKGRLFKSFIFESMSDCNLSKEVTHKEKRVEEASINQPTNIDLESGITIDQFEREGYLNMDSKSKDRANSISAASISRVSILHMHLEDEREVNEETLITEQDNELKSTGSVNLAVYKEYFKACNSSYVMFYIGLVSISIGLTVVEKYILKHWSDINEFYGHNTGSIFYLASYTLVGICGGACVLIAAFIVWNYCIIKGSTYFHDKMVASILRSPMSFFETTPIGRILNRFSEDIGQIDGNLPWVMIDLLEYILNGFVVLVVVVYNVPLMLIVIVGLLIIYNRIRQYFIPCSRELKRLMSARKSPIFSIIQESINGVETIRAYKAVNRLSIKNQKLHDSRISVNYFLNMCNRWLSMRLNFLSAIIIGSSALLVVISIGTRYQMTAGLVGFVMTYTLSVAQILRGTVKRWAEVESKTVSIERIIEYCNLKPEAKTIVEENRPKSWPTEGAIDLVNYSTRYRENLDPVLQNINLNIKPGEKIGIVGRTGAGKSSLTLALFRIIEPINGHVEIDSINTSNIGLFDLRSNLSIIPQDAHTVEGSIRSNLDPFGKFNDNQLLKVLSLAHLKDHVMAMDTDGKTGLDAQVYEGGSNLSSGQKQLLCLARALLNNSKILILDEATAAVDVQTDKIIQETIRKEFKDKTILTIAHRLDTIIDNDRIVVLEKGEVKEFGRVNDLLQSENGLFRKLCEEGNYIKQYHDILSK